MKNKKLFTIFTILLFLSLIAIGYAMVTMTLDIKGKMSVGATSWDIHFENLSDAIISGDAIELDKPILADKSTSILNINAKLSAPDDSIYYLFDVVNNGGLDAYISSIQISLPECLGTGDNKENDEILVCNNISYDLTYADDTPVLEGDFLNVNSTRKMKLKFSYKGSYLPLEEVSISNLNIAIVYSQR